MECAACRLHPGMGQETPEVRHRKGHLEQLTGVARNPAYCDDTGYLGLEDCQFPTSQRLLYELMFLGVHLVWLGQYSGAHRSAARIVQIGYSASSS